jgi:transposase-like protein
MVTRKNFSPQQKIAIVREHLLESVPVSDLCEKHGISPTNFYNWQKLLFENGAGAFERKANAANMRRQENAQQQKIDQLEARLQQKNEVIAELLEEHVQLKKANGEP